MTKQIIRNHPNDDSTTAVMKAFPEIVLPLNNLVTKIITVERNWAYKSCQK
ncbi:MAG: hypothetical protein ABR515_05045 [Nitrososphaeraceae archaeon]